MRKERQIKKLAIPGEATRQEYTVYIIIAWPRRKGRPVLYAGKTGDNREGCNPIVSRAGNHFSLNKTQSQMRNRLSGEPQKYDYQVFYAQFGPYIPPEKDKSGIEMVNRLERRLRWLCHQRFGRSMLNGSEPKKGRLPLDSVEEIVLNSLISRVHGYIQARVARKRRGKPGTR